MAILKAHNSFLKANGKILVRPEGGGDFVVIGGRKYPFVRIGDKIWITEHLDFIFDGLSIGDGFVSSSKNQAWYYDNNESLYGWSSQRRGLLYSGYTMFYMVNNAATLFPDGWRIPSIADYADLISRESVQSLNFQGGPDYGSWSGTNTSGFNCKPTGWCSTPYFYEKNAFGLLWTSSGYAEYFLPNRVVENLHFRDRGGAIRLVKDV